MVDKKIIFFDFDGTLTPGGLQAMQKNKLLETFKRLTQLTPNTSGNFSSEIKSKVFEKLWSFYIKGKSEWEIKRDIINLINNPNQKIELFPGVKERLEHLNNEGHEMHIISRSPVEFVSTILERDKIKNYFKGIHATEAEKILKGENISKSEKKLSKNLDLVKKQFFYNGKMKIRPMTPVERAKKMFSILKKENKDVVIVGDSWTDVQTTVKLIELLKKSRKKNAVSLVIQRQIDMDKIKTAVANAGGKVIFSKDHPTQNIGKVFI